METRVGYGQQWGFSATGKPARAIQVTYIASDPGKGQDLAFADAWVNASDGQPDTVTYRSTAEHEGRYLHQHFLTHQYWPPLFYASDLWDRALAEGDRWTHTFPQGLPSATGEPGRITLTYEVSGLHQTNGTCSATVTVGFGGSSNLSDKRIQLTVSEASPLPISMTVWFVDDLGDEEQTRTTDPKFQIELRGLELGTGTRLPAIDRTSPGGTGLPLHPLTDGFLPGADDVFPTDWPRVIQALENDSSASSWLQQHPNARVLKATHDLGANSSQLIDEWRLTWWPGPNETGGMENTIQKRGPILDMVGAGQVTVETETGNEVQEPKTAAGPRLSRLAELHERIYGKEIETLDCSWVEGYCRLGPHGARNKPRAGVAGAALYFTGIEVELHNGTLIKETSLAERLVPPPAGR